LDYSHKPDESADVIKSYRAKSLAAFGNDKACIFKSRLLLGEIQPFKLLRNTGHSHFNKLTVVVLAHLLSDENAALFQQTKDFSRVKTAVAVDYHVKTAILKRDCRRVVARAEINAKREQNLPAKLNIRSKTLGRRCIFVWMVKGKQKLAAACVIIEDFHIGTKIFLDKRPIIPREIGILAVSPVNVRKIPAVNVGDFLLSLPFFYQLIHINHAFDNNSDYIIIYLPHKCKSGNCTQKCT